MIETTVDETRRRNLFAGKEERGVTPASEKSWRDCEGCGTPFLALHGFLCRTCKKQVAAALAGGDKWEDSAEYDPEDPGYKIYRIRYWPQDADEDKPYDYTGWTGQMKVATRVSSGYAYLKRFPQLATADVEVSILHRFPWSREGREDSLLREIAEIILSCQNPETVTLNWQYVSRGTRWKAMENLRRSLAAGGAV